ncbi:MAG: hypothetical protein WBA99_16920 [Nodosilinea sp.]
MLRPFHVAFPVYDLANTRHFYEFKAFAQDESIFAQLEATE